jgi:hypothetical protein
VDERAPATLPKKLDHSERNRAVREGRYVTFWIYEQTASAGAKRDLYGIGTICDSGGDSGNNSGLLFLNIPA